MPTTKIIQFKGKKLGNGEHPIMLRITENRASKYISLGYSCVEKEWDKRLGRFIPPMRNYRQKNSALSVLEDRALDILSEFIRKNQSFSFDQFIDLFKGISSSKSVSDFYDIIISDLKAKERLGTMSKYVQSKNSILKFKPKRKLMFSDINYNFLKSYERFAFEGGCKKGGVHFLMRTFRAVLNEAIRQGYMKQEDYPFSTQFNKKGYSIAHLKPNTQPRALSIADMEKIKQFPIDSYPDLANSVQYFLFSYYARGINFTDMAKLTWHDVYNNRISYIRSKTGNLISFRVSESLKEILSFFKEDGAVYIFPILSSFHKEPNQIYNRIKKCLKAYNRDLKEVAKIQDINVNLTSYVARHTFATTLKMKNANVAMISQALGHADLATTETYLKKFDHNAMDTLDDLL